MFRADLSIKQVQVPQDLWCKSGHKAPEKFKRNGPRTRSLSTRFFQVVSEKNPNVNGIYCEPCLIIANAISKHKKMEMKNG